ncbi:MAG: LysM peptidoglycan-binding domain-containing protein [Deltaproteobacteria bacterium]|nr:LysM peptidoglycan-binding domain-containing protein [Deltaproteobacteria bacterium]
MGVNRGCCHTRQGSFRLSGRRSCLPVLARPPRVFFLYALVALFLCGCLTTVSRAEGNGAAVTHVVKRGETLSGIALAHKVSVEQLRGWNALRGDKIFVGQRLQVGPPAPPASYVVRSGDTLSEIAAQCRIPLSTLRLLNRINNDRIYPGQELKLIASPEKGAAPEEAFEYVVKRGDSLSAIARRFDMGVGLLRQLNRLTGDRIFPGQRLQLRPSSLDEAVHIVRSGDTLSSIALKYKTTVSELATLNGIEGSRIFVGQELRLKKTPARIHIVERGDALWEIAEAYGMSVGELKKLNGLSSDRIYPGQELQLSATQAVPYAVYTVKSGDYLGRIARLHQMSISELKSLNNIQGYVIHPGEKLKVNPILRSERDGRMLREINWDNLVQVSSKFRRIPDGNGPYYGQCPRAKQQLHAGYYEGPCLSLWQTYLQARSLLRAFDHEIDRLGRLGSSLKGWHIVLDPGHGGLDPGAVVVNLDGNGEKVYVVEHEYVYDVALRVYVLLRLHGATVTLTVLSPNHLIRRSDPPTRTFVNEKNEVYNSEAYNRQNRTANWPRGGRNGNLSYRVNIAARAFKNVPKHRRMFLSFHADIDHRSPEAPLVLYYRSGTGRYEDTPSRKFAQSILPSLGAGAYARGQNLGVLRKNPAYVKVMLELRNLAYTDHAWALRFEELRQRDAEKVVKGVLNYVRRQK